MLVLPTLPVMPTTARPQPLARPRRQVQQRLPRVGDFDDRHADRRIARPAGERGAGSDCGGGAQEVVAVALGDDRHEQLTGLQGSAVEGGTAQLDVGSDEAAAGRRGDLGCPEPHGAQRYRHADGARPDAPRRAVRRTVGRARRQLRHRHARAASHRHEPLPRHADRHLHGRRVGAGGSGPAGAGRRGGHVARASRPVRYRGDADRRAGSRCGRRADRGAAAAPRPDG